MHVYRWDLDKTYLQTDIESVRGLIRAGLQTAAEKRNVPGSRTLLRALTRVDTEARVFVLSGSPTQMRDVLAKKLELDGIVVDELVLKDNLRNLRRGRLRAVRDQLGYKLPQLLSARARTPLPATETLFGDDSEVDALVYCAYAAVVRGDLDRAGLERLLKRGRAYPDAIALALDSASVLTHADAVEDVFIHVERGVPADRFKLLGPGIWPIFSWFQAALRLLHRRRIDLKGAREVLSDCLADAPLSPGRVANLCQDAVRRQLTKPESVRDLIDDASFAALQGPVDRALQRLGDVRSPLPDHAPRYIAFLEDS